MWDGEELRELCKQAPVFDRRELGAKLHAVMVVKRDITIHAYLCFLDGLWIIKTNVSGFAYGKEIFCHGVAVWVGPSCHREVMPYCAVREK